MVGSHDEPVFIEAAHYLASRLSHRPAVMIPGAAHLPSMDQPDTFNRELLAFLGAI
jgi:pimeloyl-ACP methyl ester carboxylesterase